LVVDIVKVVMQIECSGGLFLTKDTKRFLFLLRSQGKTAGTWGLVGGKKEPEDATLYDALKREISEEIGKTPAIKKIVPLELFTSNDQQFQYNTYILIVEKEFIPTLNEEHSGYAWCDLNSWPKPLHQGVKTSLNSRSIRTKIELLLELI
jgi:8-oxo-dGTP pyrophosphatase MutT (NUDIX family)